MVADGLHEAMKMCAVSRKLFIYGNGGLNAKWPMRFLNRAFSTGQGAWRVILWQIPDAMTAVTIAFVLDYAKNNAEMQ